TSDAHAHVAATRAAPRWTRPRVRRYVEAIVHQPHDATTAGNATWCRFDGAERPRKYVNATAPNAVAPAVAATVGSWRVRTVRGIAMRAANERRYSPPTR